MKNALKYINIIVLILVAFIAFEYNIPQKVVKNLFVEKEVNGYQLQLYTSRF